MHTAERICVVNSYKIHLTGMSREKLVRKKHFHFALYSKSHNGKHPEVFAASLMVRCLMTKSASP